MSSNIHLKKEAMRLRRHGKSYNDIIKKLGIKSKGTLSLWFRDLYLSKHSNKLLEKNNKLAHQRGLFIANKNRNLKIKSENDHACMEGEYLIKSISKRELLLVGASLYWGEGSKSEKSTGTPLDFSNSDPYMVSVYMKFLREILKVSDEKIRAGIHLYPTTSINKARKFWATITNLPIDRFFIVTQISRASKDRRPFNILPHGTIAIKVSSRLQFHKVKGMIRGIINGLA